MKNPVKKVMLPLLLVWVLLISVPIPAQAAEKYMEGKYADFQILLDETGGAQIQETWECYFGGDTITRYRRHYGLEDPAEMDIMVWEILMDGEPMLLLDEPDESRPEHCAAVVYQEDGVSLEIYLNALDAYHTFEITYYVTNAVQVYEDAAEFYWTLTGDQEAFDIEIMTGFIEIPYGTQDMGLYFWGHGPSENAYFDALVDEDGLVNQFELYKEDIRKDQPVSVRFAMPTELFPQCTRTRDWEGLQDILAEEHGYADIAGSVGETLPEEECLTEPDYEDPYLYEEEETSWFENFCYTLGNIFYPIFRLIKFLTVIASFAPFVYMIFFRHRIDRKVQSRTLPDASDPVRFKPAQAPRYYRTLPDDLEPALVYKLMCTYPATEEGAQTLKKGSAFSATVLDLVEKGLLELVQDVEGELTYYVTPEAETAEVTQYEKNVLELYSRAGASLSPKSTRCGPLS